MRNIISHCVMRIRESISVQITDKSVRLEALGVYGENGTPNANYANIYTFIYIYISEISIDMNRECARSIIVYLCLCGFCGRHGRVFLL